MFLPDPRLWPSTVLCAMSVVWMAIRFKLILVNPGEPQRRFSFHFRTIILAFNPFHSTFAMDGSRFCAKATNLFSGYAFPWYLLCFSPCMEELDARNNSTKLLFCCVFQDYARVGWQNSSHCELTWWAWWPRSRACARDLLAMISGDKPEAWEQWLAGIGPHVTQN